MPQVKTRRRRQVWHAVPVLGITQILAWGTIYYPPVLTVPLIAAERGWSLATAMGGFSVGLAFAGLVSPGVGALIDRHGGHWIMAAGSCLGAGGLMALAVAQNVYLYFLAWAALGFAMAATLYPPAFATLGRVFGAKARRSITTLTLIGGFASTVSWPTTHLLIETVGWRDTYLIYAALLIFVAAPLHAFFLPRTRAPNAGSGAKRVPETFARAQGVMFALVAGAFAAYAFVPSALGAHLLAMFDRLGLDRGTVVAIGALFGPAQVGARLCEFFFARTLHPLLIARFAVALLVAAFALLAIFGLSVWTAATFAMLFGVSNGLITIATGTVPLALFGAESYGRTLGRIGAPVRMLQATAPVVVAVVIERTSDPTALAVIASFALASLLGFLLVRRPTGTA